MDAIIIGYVGGEPKKTEKGYSFNVSSKYYQNGEEKTQWVYCFINFPNNVVDYLKAGTLVYVLGEIIVGVYKRSSDEYIPTVSCIVNRVKLLPSKK